MRDSFALFAEATWQWVPIGLSAPVRTHIIRTELEASARLMGLETISPSTFSDIQVMEQEALRYWSNRR